MARKAKPGINYFSHDVDMMQDIKIKIIKAKHGLTGYAIFLSLLEEIYREEGYYVKADSDFKLLFACENMIEEELLETVINDCVSKGLFSQEKYEKYGILTSERIQSNYCEATDRRRTVEFYNEYLLIDVISKYDKSRVKLIILDLNGDILKTNDEENIDDVDVIEQNVDIDTSEAIGGQHDVNISTPEAVGGQHDVTHGQHDVNNGTQSKVNKSKVNKSKVNNIYSQVFEYYLSMDIIHHKKFTPAMKKALNRSIKEYGTDLELFKKMIMRHKKKIEMTCHDGQYAVKKRSFAELFGQQKKDSVELICSDYTDEKWESYLSRRAHIGKVTSINKNKKNAKLGSFDIFESRSQEYTDEELEKILGIK